MICSSCQPKTAIRLALQHSDAEAPPLWSNFAHGDAWHLDTTQRVEGWRDELDFRYKAITTHQDTEGIMYPLTE